MPSVWPPICKHAAWAESTSFEVLVDPAAKENGCGNHRGADQADGGRGRALAGILFDHVRRLLRGPRSENHRRLERPVRGHAQPQTDGPLRRVRIEKPPASGLLQSMR